MDVSIVSPEEKVRRGEADLVVARFPEDELASWSTVESVRARSCADEVEPTSAVHRIGATEGKDHIMTVAPPDLVVAVHSDLGGGFAEALGGC